jgi:hypothetical protein
MNSEIIDHLHDTGSALTMLIASRSSVCLMIAVLRHRVLRTRILNPP